MPDRNHPELRTLSPRDVPAALHLSVEAGWNQTADDWSTLIALSPTSCLGIEIDGELVSTCTLTCYERRLAWVGMVLTKMSHRGRGFARRLLTHALTLADQMGISTVKLDATDQGQPLYEKLGFRCEQPVERWARDGQPGSRPEPIHPRTAPPAQWYRSDQPAFGTDRSQLLEALARRSSPLLEKGSYLLTRMGREKSFLGPCVAATPEVARTLIAQALPSDDRSGWLWDLFPKNTSAVTLALDFRFAPQRCLTRMFRGQDLVTREDSIFALAGFELG